MDADEKDKCKTLVCDLPVNVLLDVSKHLNPIMVVGGDWRSLAGGIGMKYIDILNIESKPDPTMEVLRSWWKNTDVYVSDLIDLLRKMKRADVIKIVKPHEFYYATKVSQPSESKRQEENEEPQSRPSTLPLENGLSTESSNSIENAYEFYASDKTHPSESREMVAAYALPGNISTDNDEEDNRSASSGEEAIEENRMSQTIPHNRISQRAANVTDMSVQTQVPSPTAATAAPQFPSPENETSLYANGLLKPLTAPHDKIALVIGNQNYTKKSYNQLSYTLNDAFDIASALGDLDFKVISLVDLTLTEMRTSMLAFCRLLGSGIYAVIYYAGHGYELDGENYLIPVDARSASPNESIRAQEFLQEMQACDTLLNLMFLDCCRTRAKDGKAPRCSLKRKTQGNTIIAYSCCAQHGAFEEPDQKNGVYARHLLQNINRNTRIENILMDVSSAVVESRSVDQRPTYESDAYMECRLTVPIIPEKEENKIRERFDLWQEGSRLPDPLKVSMDDVDINLLFHKGFSNVMITEVFVTNKKQRPIKNFKFSISLCDPLKVEVGGQQTDIDPMEENKRVGAFRIFRLQKLYNESLFLAIDFQTDEWSIIKKIDFGSPLITGITGAFHDWIKERKYESPSWAKSSWI